jgi:hypothetical protein
MNYSNADSDTLARTARGAAAACDQLYRRLSRSVGSDGCHALFTRALAEARITHPALEQIQLRARLDPYIEGLTDSIAKHGDTATADALESLFAGVVTLLGRLVGDDMATRLVEGSARELPDGDERSATKKEDAR